MTSEGQSATQSIPADATAVIDLLNSRAHGITPALPETLDSHRTASEILRPFGQCDGRQPTPELIARVRDLRTALLDIVTAPDPEDTAAAWARLTRLSSSVTLKQVFTSPGEVRLRQRGGDPVIGGIALAVAELITDGSWPRIRTCANESCAHAFYDTTRSRTQRWHSYEVCGNRNNVAAYRARKNARSAP
ncbi:CGNR zinc finger domain-containing protein [Streptomyces sp. NPDC001068]|uniref:CGNR zinc finger domain-containing protein n=1 Tax=Streptomyces sp. NPDC001068 TaxID=3364544 RepID=UPI0036C644DA